MLWPATLAHSGSALWDVPLCFHSISDDSYVSRKERLSQGNSEHDKQSMGVGDTWKCVAFHLDWVEITPQEHHLPQGNMGISSSRLIVASVWNTPLLFVHRDPDICQLWLCPEKSVIIQRGGNPRTQKAETIGSWAPCLPRLHSESFIWKKPKNQSTPPPIHLKNK